MEVLIPDKIAKDLLYYLSRSYFREDGDIVSNIVAEEAICGNELAQRAMEARRIVMEMITT